VTLAIETGEVFGLLGLNGAGKTTLIRLLATLLVPSDGMAAVFGRDVAAEPAAVRRLIGLVTCDERSFYWRLSGRQNLEFVAGVHGLSGRETRERIGDLAECLGMTDYIDERYSGYSAGMKQKVAIARGLLARPRLLFMDEPTKGLDPVAAVDTIELIGKQVIPRYGITVLITTHILREAEALCDRVAIMHGGKILACDSPAGLRREVTGVEVYVLRIGGVSATSLERVAATPGVLACRRVRAEDDVDGLELRLRDGGVLSSVLRALLAGGGTVLACDHPTVSLEEVFATIVARGGSPVTT
jgi:ABC-2 type transport system ATP-binding protein